MEQRALGRSGIEVSRLILGCGNFGGVGSAPAFYGQGETEEQAGAIMDAAWAAGITTFDTADAYGGGRSETFVGRWIRSRGVRPVLTTKTFYATTEDADSGLSRKRIRRQIRASLERLGVDRIDLYLPHAMDPATPLEETSAAFDELQREGTIGAWGGSNVDVAWVEEARPAWVQNSYSLLDREDEAGVIPVCSREGLGYTPFGPLAGGWLTGKYRRGEEPPAGSRMTLRPEAYEHLRSDRTFDALEAFEARAHDRGTSPATLALAWLLGRPHVTAVVLGPRGPEQLQPALDALELRLDADEVEAIGALFA